LSVAANQVERDLRVEHVFRQWLEGKKIHGLLVEFVHALLSVLRGRLEQSDNHSTNAPHIACAQQQQCQNHGRGVSGDARSGLKFRRLNLSSLSFYPK